MLDVFIEQAYQAELQKTASSTVRDSMRYLTDEQLAQVVNEPEKLACFHDGRSWLDQFKGTPLLDQAIALEQQDLEIEAMSDQERQLSHQNWARRDALRLQRRMLELELAKSSAGATAPPAPQAAAQLEPVAPPVPEPKTAMVQYSDDLPAKLASVRMAIAYQGPTPELMGKLAMLQGLENMRKEALIGKAIGTVLGGGLGALRGVGSAVSNVASGTAKGISGFANRGTGWVGRQWGGFKKDLGQSFAQSQHSVRQGISGGKGILGTSTPRDALTGASKPAPSTKLLPGRGDVGARPMNIDDRINANAEAAAGRRAEAVARASKKPVRMVAGGQPLTLAQGGATALAAPMIGAGFVGAGGAVPRSRVGAPMPGAPSISAAPMLPEQGKFVVSSADNFINAALREGLIEEVSPAMKFKLAAGEAGLLNAIGTFGKAHAVPLAMMGAGGVAGALHGASGADGSAGKAVLEGLGGAALGGGLGMGGRVMGHALRRGSLGAGWNKTLEQTARGIGHEAPTQFASGLRANLSAEAQGVLDAYRQGRLATQSAKIKDLMGVANPANVEAHGKLLDAARLKEQKMRGMLSPSLAAAPTAADNTMAAASGNVVASIL